LHHIKKSQGNSHQTIRYADAEITL